MESAKSERYEIDVIQTALKEEFSMQVNGLQRVDDVDMGDNSDVLFADYNGQKIFIKLDANNKYFAREAAGLELFHKFGIPSANVLGNKEKTKNISQAIIIQTGVPGVALSNREMTPALCEAAGRILKKIHQIKLPGFGELRVLDGNLGGESATWHDAQISGRQDFNYLKKHGFLNDEEIMLLYKVHGEMTNVELPQASFLHCDFHSKHIFTDGENITGVIDLSGAFAGDPRYDVAIAQYYFGPEKVAAFNRGYGEEANDPIVSKYRLFVAARKVQYRHEKGFTDRLPSAIAVLKQCLAEVSRKN